MAGFCAILKWLLHWHDGKVPNTKNLCRAAARAGIDRPLTLIKAKVQVRFEDCLHKIFALQLQALELWKKHMKWQLSQAEQK